MPSGGVGGKRRWWEVATATGCSTPFEADQGRALGGEHGGGGQRRRGRRGRGGAAARAPPPVAVAVAPTPAYSGWSI